MSGWRAEESRNDLLDDGIAQSECFDKFVEHTDHVVLRIVDSASGNRSRGSEQVSAFFRHESKRVSEHLGEVMPHQERFVLIDG